MSEARGLLERVAAEGVRAVDFRFTDLAGRWRHTAIEAGAVDEAILTEGFLVDGSALPGWRDPNEADLLLRPDLATALIDPFAAQPTLVLTCDMAEPATGLGYERDPRSTAARAEAWLLRQRQADRIEVGVEIHLFIFDAVQTALQPARLAVELYGPELRAGASGAAGAPLAQGALAHRPPAGAERLAIPPEDQTADIRAEMAAMLASLGFRGVRHDHGRAPQQARFAFRETGIVAAADRIQLLKDVARHVAASYGKLATFMAKPLMDMPGSGLGIELSLHQGERNAFAGQGYADLSPLCLAWIGGILRRAHALNALTNPTTNSYRRLRPGEEEPVHLAYAAFNRSAAIRIPFSATPQGKAVEVRFPDPLANPYLALCGLIMAGQDGVQANLEPGDAMDRNLYDLPPQERSLLKAVAGSLDTALSALSAEREFLTRGEVVADALIDAYVEIKRAECDRLARIPHPLEFELHLGG